MVCFACTTPAIPTKQIVTEKMQELEDAFLRLHERCGRYRFPRDDVLRHFPLPFVVRFAKKAQASSKWCGDAELLYFVARVLSKCAGPQSDEGVDSVLASLYLAVFSLPQGRNVLNGQEWAVFDAYAEECLGCSLHAAISAGTDDEKLKRMKDLVQARRREDYRGSETTDSECASQRFNNLEPGDKNIPTTEPPC